MASEKMTAACSPQAVYLPILTPPSATPAERADLYDRQYARFQTLADDLLELLDGAIANIDQQRIQPEHRQRGVDEG